LLGLDDALQELGRDRPLGRVERPVRRGDVAGSETTTGSASSSASLALSSASESDPSSDSSLSTMDARRRRERGAESPGTSASQ
jgi:hypothetical protein